jgi:hypothetical protein
VTVIAADHCFEEKLMRGRRQSSLVIVAALTIHLLVTIGVSARTISFSGRTWDVRYGIAGDPGNGPGNGCWSDDPASVWVDTSGFLHLKIRQLGDGSWCQAQVIAQSYADYGDHLFWTNSRLDLLPSNVVFSGYLYANDNHEIDIEMTRSFGTGNNLWYTVQPYSSSAPKSSASWPLVLTGNNGDSYSSHHFVWSSAGSVSFESWYGHCLVGPCGGLIAAWPYSGLNTPASSWHLRPSINLWINNGTVSSPQEVIVASYSGPQIPHAFPNIEVTAPNGGETWSVGSPHTVTWASSALSQSGQLYIILSQDGGLHEYPTPIAVLDPSVTSYSWTPLAAHATTAAKLAVGNFVNGEYEAFDWSDQNFTIATVPPQSPTVTTNAASNFTQTSTTVAATVNPNGASTTLYFDYGPTTSYGNQATYGAVGSGTTALTRSLNLTNLTCGTTYQYKARAQNSAGTNNGGNQTFTTSTCPQQGTTELLTNGSFASGSSGWVLSGNFFADSRFSVCHSCPGYAYFANADGSAGNNLSGSLYQTVTIPANATSAAVSFWWYITTSETAIAVFDRMNVTIQNSSGGVLATVASLSNLSRTNEWVQNSADLMAYRGQTIRLNFSATTDVSLPTVFRVDDASILVTATVAAPTVITGSASSIGQTSTTLSGTVNPNGASTTLYFDYGPNTSYGGLVTYGSVGSGTTNVTQSANVNDLSCGTTYQWRARAENSGGANGGTNQAFTTNSCPPQTCTSFIINPSSATPGYGASSQPVTVTGSPAGCQGGGWITSGNGLWLTVSPSGGSGSGSATVSWGQNTLTSSRSDSATVAGNTFSVTQGAAPGGSVQSYTFTHLAGSDIGAGYFDGTGSEARFSYSYGVAIDNAGNAYIADTRNSTIRKVTSAGVVTTLAGLAGNRGSDDGTGGAARFAWPSGVATDAAGNVYVADTANHTIRKITPSGAVTTLAGLAGSSGSADGTNSAARFMAPQGVAIDSAGNIYVADTGNNTIRKVTPIGLVTTLAGLASSSGSNDGTGSAARFNQPTGVTSDTAGNIYVADQYNFTIRKITSSGVVTTFAGLAGSGGHTDGTGTAARLWFPKAVATDSAASVYVADGLDTIRRITSAGVVTTLAGQVSTSGSSDGTGSAAQFYEPWGVATDTTGNVYVMDTYNDTLRKITPAGVVTTLAGLAGNKYGSANGTGSAAQFFYPFGVTTDNAGNVFVADSSNLTIRKITPSGLVSTLAGLAGSQGSADGTGSEARFRYTYGVATDSAGNVYVADSANNTIRKITSAGVVTTLAGLAVTSGSDDGTGSAARFNYPYGLATDSAGNIYVADTYNYTIRKVTPAGVVTTLAGLAGNSGSADGTGSAARFNAPFGVATDSGGNVYVADYSNQTIRKITPSGVVTTLAGLAGAIGSTDGTGSAARFFYPSGLVTDSAGNLYVTDFSSNTIRKITPGGVVTTLAGRALSWGGTDGIADAVRFDGPSGIAIDNGGNLYVGDQNNQAIRVGRQAIPDVAQIDSATGTLGVARQLDATPQNATTWQWSMIRRPSGSTAQLSSTTLRNPTFTPDVADLYQFQLIASNSSGMSITIVSLSASALAPATPTGVVAAAITSTRVDVAWTTVAGTTYQIDRQAAGGAFSQIGTSPTNSFSDTTASADSAYLYRVRAVNTGGASVNSAADLATTVIFIDNPLTAGTLVKAVHLSQLRTAVNAVRLLAGLGSGTYTGAATSGTVIGAIHISELRASLDAVLGTLGFSTGGYTNTSLTGIAIKAVHSQELRDRVK